MSSMVKSKSQFTISSTTMEGSSKQSRKPEESRTVHPNEHIMQQDHITNQDPTTKKAKN